MSAMRAAIATGLALCLTVVPLTPARAAEPIPAQADPSAPPSEGDPELELKLRKAKGMTDTGIIVLAIGGGVALVAGVIALAMYRPPSERGDAYLNPAPISGGLGAVAGGAVIIGGTLLGVGLGRKKRAREAARQRPTGMVVPFSLPHGGGLGLVGRF